MKQVILNWLFIFIGPQLLGLALRFLCRRWIAGHRGRALADRKKVTIYCGTMTHGSWNMLA